MMTSTKRLEEALRVHKDTLKLIVDGEDHDDYDADDADDAALLPVAKHHVEGLRNTCQRLGGFNGQKAEIKDLIDKVRVRFQTIEVNAPEKWDLKKKPEEQVGTWREPETWTIRMDVKGSNKRHGSRKQVKRARSSFGMNGGYAVEVRG